MLTRQIVVLMRGLVRPLVLLGLLGAIIALAFLGRDIPEVLGTAFATAMGFYFGVREASREQRDG